ncbi:putative capsular polysaccharide synthesis family protein [Microcoleus sp. D2_18a_D3]|uniref:putative capsular polysaccharide synthesis family protein n=1 Tax=Microcoleus sp. D2_18a_D3 TaxID=3055330 RepID=UPI002FD4E6DD
MNQPFFTTPIVLIIFKRPHTTKQVFEVIQTLQPCQLFVIADGPNPEHPGEIEKCAATRAIIDRVDWKCEVYKNYSDINLGCKQRVSTGLDWVFSQVEEAIILEDDCIPKLSFFRFCQELLERYRHNERVFQITGENTHGYRCSDSSYYFSAYSFYWGWATWKRAWKYFDGSLKQWLQVRESQWLQDYLGDYPSAQYWAEIFDLTYNGFNSWGWAWTFTCFVNQGLCAVPNQNLISNVGFGEDAAHTTWEVDEIANLPTQSIDFPLHHPTKVTVNIQAEAAIDKVRFTGRKYLRGMRQNAIDLFNQGQYESALEIWEKCINFRPDLSNFNEEKARCLQKIRKHKQTIQSVNNHKIEKKANHPRFLVYTMGKVGSTSISMSLKKYAIQVYDIHFLDETYLQNNMHKGHCVDGYFVLKNWLGKPLKVISLVRNPIDVNIGGFFQNIEIYYPHLTPEQIQQLTVEELIDKFWTLNPNYPLGWFEREFNKSFNFDVYSQPFSTLGWKTYFHHSYHILIMQAELMDSQKQEILRGFTGMRDFEIENHNISSQKWYGNLYKQFKKKLVISEEYLEKMLKSKFTKHFYTASQIDEFYRCVHK